MLTEREVKQLTEKVLSLSRAEQTQVTVFTEDSALTRFANNQVHQNVAQRDASVVVRAGLGRRYGIASTNDTSAGGLQGVVERALEVARMLPESEEFLPLPEPQAIGEADGYALATAEFGPLQRAAGVRVACEKAGERGLTAAGAFRVDIVSLTVANSLGLFAQRFSTRAELLAVVMSDSSSGHAGQLAVDVRQIDPERVADEAVGRAERGRNPRGLGPGEYEVVLEEYAVSDILDFLGYMGFGALAVQEGRSFMTGRLGQQVMGANISIWDDGLDPTGVPQLFDYEGMPKRRVDFIVDGVANTPCYDRRTGARDGKPSTGHGLPPSSTMGPVPMNMFLKPGDASKEELIASVKRGLLVTRFWYTRVVHPRTLHMTGMTRDGTFLIEDGEVVAPVKNLRFTESYVEALSRVERIGREPKLVREFFSYNRVPALKIGSWNFTGATEY